MKCVKRQSNYAIQNHGSNPYCPKHQFNKMQLLNMLKERSDCNGKRYLYIDVYFLSRHYFGYYRHSYYYKDIISVVLMIVSNLAYLYAGLRSLIDQVLSVCEMCFYHKLNHTLYFGEDFYLKHLHTHKNN